MDYGFLYNILRFLKFKTMILGTLMINYSLMGMKIELTIYEK